MSELSRDPEKATVPFDVDKPTAPIESKIEEDSQIHQNTMEEANGGAMTEPGLKKNIKSRHIQFIALGTGIGTGLFIGTASTLASGGPGSLMIDFSFIGCMMLFMLFAIGELASLMPFPGAFAEYARRFLDPAWGFAIGCNYLMQWLATLPLEFTAATIVITFFDPHEVVPRGVWIAIFMVAIILVNIFGARGYAEVEFVATFIKMITIIGFVICAIVIDCGGSPSGTYLGAAGWHAPGGAFQNGFKGFCSVLTTAAFAFTATELVGLAAAETQAPQILIPKACKRVIWRVVIFYVVPLLMITMVILPTDPNLRGESNYDPRTSPFVLTIKYGQIKVLPYIMNGVILMSTLSVSNSAAFAGSRVLQALSQQGYAPKIFGYIDRTGRPLVASATLILFGLLAFLVYSSNMGHIFSWLLGISGLSVVITWGTICACHIRFRRAWKAQGYTLEQLPWVSPLGEFGSWVGLAVNILIIFAQFYVSAFPIGEGEMDSGARVEQFFLGFISVPIILVFFVGYKLVKRTKVPRLEDIDLLSGRRALVSKEEYEQQKAESRARPVWKKILQFLF